MSLKLDKVLVLDGVDSVCASKLQEAGMQVTTLGKLTKEELVAQIKVHDALIVRSATKVSCDVIGDSTRLKVIGRAGTGVDNIHVESATRKGILVMNTPGGNTMSAAEHTCALICALSRSIPQACASLKDGAWDRKKLLGNELSEKVLAIVGLGRIGKEVSDRMKSFGMRVIGYDPIVSPETAASWGIEYLPLAQVWPMADYITVHTPLIPQTRYMINYDVLRQCKPTVKIVNVARGGIVEEKALLKALEEGVCGGAALDVFEEEPPKDLTLIKHPKVICTPHLGANTVEAQKRVAVDMAEQLIAMSEGRKLVGVVNGAALVEAGSPEARPWIELASSLGVVAARVVKPDKGVHISVQLYGSTICSLSRLMTPALLAGYLKTDTKTVNLVNSFVLAKEASVAIEVSHSTSPHSQLNLSNSVAVCVQGGAKKLSLIGSTNEARVILYGVNDSVFTSGVTLDKNLLFFASSRPQSVLGAVATTLQSSSSSLHSVLCSSSPSSSKEGNEEGDKWLIAQTDSPVLGEIPPVQGARLVAQIQF